VGQTLAANGAAWTPHLPDVRHVVGRVVEEFVRSVYADHAVPERASRVLHRVPDATVTLLVGYVGGVGDLSVLLEVFSISQPRYAGVYFPAPVGQQVERWRSSVARAIERLVEIKLECGGTEPATVDRQIASMPIVQRPHLPPPGARVAQTAEEISRAARGCRSSNGVGGRRGQGRVAD
jgi:hypothetical protein